MAVTNVRAEWVDGNLVVKDAAGDIICTIDGANRKITVPTGAALESDLLTLLSDLPTTNQAAPAIWNDNGVLKVGTA